MECFRSVRNELPPKSCRWWAGGASNGSLLQLSTPKEKDGQPPSLSRPGTSARLATTATSRSPRTTTLHESSLKQMVALLEASTARQSEALRERFDELEKHLVSRFEQGLKAFRAEHVQPLAAHVTTLGSKSSTQWSAPCRAARRVRPNAPSGRDRPARAISTWERALDLWLERAHAALAWKGHAHPSCRMRVLWQGRVRALLRCLASVRSRNAVPWRGSG